MVVLSLTGAICLYFLIVHIVKSEAKRSKETAEAKEYGEFLKTVDDVTWRLSEENGDILEAEYLVWKIRNKGSLMRRRRKL